MSIHKNIYLIRTILMLVLGLDLAQAQTTTEGWVMQNIHGPSQLNIVESVPVDVNNDGLIDVVSVSIEDGHLRAYINQGDLLFTEQLISDQVKGAFRLTAADLNQDAKIDFLIPSIESNSIVGFIAGDEGYSETIIASGVLLPTDAQAGDFNDDGMMDVVSLSFEEDSVILHTQIAPNQYVSTEISNSVFSPRKLIVADFNADDLPDFMVASSFDNSVRLFSNTGNGSFEVSLVSNQIMGVRNIVSCDLNGDQYLDFIAAATSSNKATLFFNQRKGGFMAQDLSAEIPGVVGLLCANLDQDPDNELITIAGITNEIYRHEIIGIESQSLIANNRDAYISLYVDTFEKHGQPMLLTQGFFANKNLLYEIEGVNQEQVIWQNFPDGASSVSAGDINSDGITDYVVASFRDNRLYFYDGSNLVAQVLAEGLEGALDVQIIDLDGDKKLDILLSTAFGDQMLWFRNTGPFLFEKNIVAEINNPLGFVVADINQDQQQNIVLTSSLTDSVWWYETNGNGGFIAHQISSESDGAKDVCTGYFNDDELIDLVVVNFFGNSLDLFINTGNGGSFMKQEITNNITRPQAVQGLDFDFDEDVDVVVSVLGDGKVLLFENKGNLSFTERILTDGLESPRGLFIIQDSIQKVASVFVAAHGENQLLQLIAGQLEKVAAYLISEPLYGVNSIFSQVTETELDNERLLVTSSIDSALRLLIHDVAIFKNDFE